ncbi:MAG: hypothetical protein L0Y62_03465, partial [Nitrospirae bacterium]|nr:hypothetical protein [Nitrospirota bacterium]
ISVQNKWTIGCKSKAYGAIYAAKARVTLIRLETTAEAVQMYKVKTIWFNNDLHLNRGSFLAKKLSYMPLYGLFWTPMF